jgi:hypothetical protein
MNAYVDAVKLHKIDVLFPSGGDPDEVVKSVRKAMQQTEEYAQVK